LNLSKIMPRRLIQFIFILIALLFATGVKAGTIIRPVHNFGLVGYWSFQEGAGTIANDKSGHSNHFILHGNPAWVDGKIGKALNFDVSAKQYGSISDADQNDLEFNGGDYTVNFWINFHNKNGDNQVILKKYNSDDPEGYFITWEWPSDNFYLGVMHRHNWTPYTAYSSFSANDINDGTWYMMSVIFNDTIDKITFCLNASCDAPQTMAYTSTGNNLDVEVGRQTGDIEHLDAELDELRVYNRALSESEIQRLYKISQPKVLAKTRTGLVGYWSFDEGTGTKVGDMSGIGNHGTFAAGITQSDWVDGKFGKGLELDGGSNDYVDTDSLAFNGVSALTVSFWVKPYAFKGEYSSRWEASEVSNQSRTSFGTQGASYNGYSNTFAATIRKDSGTNCVATVTKSNYSARQWYHYVAVYDGTQTGNARLKIYIDGVSKTFVVDGCGGLPATIYDPGATAKIRFGYNGAGTSYYANGILDEIRIYNRTLETNEITALYNSGLAKVSNSQNTQLTNGLVGLWSFNGSDMDGNTAIDRSSGGNNGTITGATKTIGKVGQALSFNGSGDSITVPYSASLDISGDHTISAWVYLTNSNPTGQTIFVKNSNYAFWFEYGGTLRFSDDSSHYIQTVQSTWSAGQWYHFAGVFDDSFSASKIYVNGVSVSVTQSGDWSPTLGLDSYIGSMYGSGDYINGRIDEVRIYNRALSAQEVLRLYNLGR
jgi:hypothetical protein